MHSPRGTIVTTMKVIGSYFVIGIAMLGIVSCSTVQVARTTPAGPPVPCNPGVCTLTVTVTSCGGVGGITVNPPYVSVASPQNIRWNIVTPGFVFAANGIEFDPPNAQFEPQHSPDATEFRLRNHHRQTGDFYYFVNVQGCLRADPWMRN